MKRILLAVAMLLPAVSQAEDAKELLSRTEKLLAEGRYSQALSELSWAQREIQNLHMRKLEEFLPTEAAGLKGGAATNNSAMGMMAVERIYSDSAGNEIKLSLLGGAGGAAQAGFGALAGLAQMAAAMGAATPGIEPVRIQNRRGTLDKSSGLAKVMLSLNSGLSLSAEAQSASIKPEQLQKLIEAIKLDELEKYAATN